MLPSDAYPTGWLQALEREARQLMDEHGLSEWRFRWDRSVKRMGQCNYTRRTISVSEKLAGRATRVLLRDTILHEIARALCEGCGHNERWRETARVIGCTAERCYLRRGHGRSLPGKWQAVCPNCNHRFHRHHRPDDRKR